jgi:hypothetical protein
MLITWPPQDLKRRLSALDENLGPSIVMQVPEECTGMLDSSAACFKQERVSTQKGSSTGK